MGVARSGLWAPDLQNTRFSNDSNRGRNLSSVLLILSHEGQTDKLTMVVVYFRMFYSKFQ